MSSKRATNRHKDKPVDTANIRQPATAAGVIDTDIPQEEYPDGVRLASRRAPANILRREEQLANLERVAREVGAGLEPPVPDAIRRSTVGPGEISRITRNDVELFFDAAHMFRTNLANVLPDIANKLGQFILATPYTIIDSSGHPVQMVPDATAMTPAQAKLAGLVLHRLLPPLTDMDIEGRPGLGRGNHVDARQVRITVNTVNTNDHDPTDKRLREAGKSHPNAARQIAPVTMNLGEVVEQAQKLVGEIDGVDPKLFPDTLESEPAQGTADGREDEPDPHPAKPAR
jgi:hypothetical protein